MSEILNYDYKEAKRMQNRFRTAYILELAGRLDRDGEQLGTWSDRMAAWYEIRGVSLSEIELAREEGEQDALEVWNSNRKVINSGERLPIE